MRDTAASWGVGTSELPGARTTKARLVVATLLVGAAYFLSVQLALALRLPGSSFSPLWPPPAIMLAVLLLTPQRRWWIWLLAMVPAHVLAYLPYAQPWWRQCIQLGHQLVMVLPPAILLRRYAPQAVRLRSFSGMLALLVAVAGTSLLAPVGMSAIYVAIGVTDSFWLMWQLIAFSNTLAFLTILPAILLIVQHGRSWLRRATMPRVLEALVLAALVLGVSELVFGTLAAGPASDTYIRTATLPLLLWTAVRFGPGGLSLAVTAMMLMALWNAALGYGPFTAGPPDRNVLEVPSYFLTFAAPLLLLAALISDRRRGERDLVLLNTQLEDRVATRTAQLEHANAELAVARDQAEAANRAKSDFLATMSHELRTPMNAVIGMTTLLQHSQLTSAQRDDLETIARSGRMLLTLINDVLDYSKIDANKLTLEYHPFALRACVEEALDLLAPLVDAKHLALRYDPDSALPDEFIGDPARLRQVLVNLLSNAVRFTERGEIAVVVAGTQRPGAAGAARMWDLTIAIRDTGVGIRADQMARIFQPFTQAGATLGRYGGTGLGLSISRRLAELMGGRIHVASTPGSGSVFTVELPAQATAAPAPDFLAPAQPILAGKRALVLAGDVGTAQTLVRQLGAWQMVPVPAADTPQALARLGNGQAIDVLLLVPELAIESPVALVDELREAVGQPTLPVVLGTIATHRALDQVQPSNTMLLQLPLHPAVLYGALYTLLGGEANSGAAQRAPEFDATTGERWPLRILLAEDNVTNQQVAQRLLAKLGYQAQVVANGLDVLDALRRQDFDLVLMDVQMPEMSGSEATRYIRTFWPPSRQPRIAAMTAYASEENRAWLISTGMDDYIRKPVRVEDLVRVLRAAARVGDQLARSAPDDITGTLDIGLYEAFLATVGGDDPVADAAFIESYIADMGEQLRTLRQALSSADAARLSRASHTLEGLSLQLGARDLAILSRRINVGAEAVDPHHVAALLDSAELAYVALQRAIDELGARGD